LAENEYQLEKNCDRCGVPVEEYYTLQVTAGEPLKDSIAEEDCRLCLHCRIELHQWLETKQSQQSKS